MKKLILVLTLTFSVTLGFSQKIQLKKGILSKDDVQLGKLEGEATLLNGTNVSITSMDGSPLVKIKDPLVKFGSVYHEPIRYYSVEFPSIGKTVSFIPDQKKFFTSEKKLVEYLFENIGKEFLGKDGVNAELVNQFIASKDQTQAIAKDTTHISNLIKISKEKIKEPLITRQADGAVRLVSKEKITISTMWQETLETFNIVKGNVIVGQLTKNYKGDPSVPSTSPSSKSVTYVVNRKVNSFTLDGETVDFISLAKVKSAVTGPDIYTYCESKSIKISDIYSAEQEIVDYLIEKGCL